MDVVDGTCSKVGDANVRDRFFLRGQALWEPNDALSVRIIGDYTYREESCCAAAYISTHETIPGATPGSTADSPTTNRIVQILNAIAPGSTPVNPSPYDRAAYITAGRDYVSKLEDWGVSAEINYDFGPAKLTSITAYRDYKS